MKFDFVIGNPPYQGEAVGEQKSFTKPVYNLFMDAAYQVADKTMLITPARFLFNAGATPKKWNDERLHDPHFKVCKYYPKSSDVFTNVEIKGGVAIHYRDIERDYGHIEVFTNYEYLNSIVRKVVSAIDFETLTPHIYIQNKFNLEELYKAYPDAKKGIGSDGKDKRLESNIFSKVPQPFTDERVNADDIYVIGIVGNKRVWRYIPQKYIETQHENLNAWKVILPKSSGSGAIGEVISTPLIGKPLIGKPLIGYTQTFISIGVFETENEAQACLKYVKTKFARTMLGVLKITQSGKKETWKYVPLQDFTENSDIDWTAPIAEIDKQLYKKYALSQDEIRFIESHIKEML